MKPDREIDQLAYELYGLTENEIKIVEHSKKFVFPCGRGDF